MRRPTGAGVMVATLTLGVLLVPLAPTGGVAHAEDAAEPPPEAFSRARAVHLRVPGQDVIEAGVVRARAGEQAEAVGSAVGVGGEHPARADTRTGADEDAAETLTWEDDNGSLRVDGPYADVRAGSRSSDARSGVGSLGASGFAMGDELFTWEQQEMMLGTWEEMNQALVARLNEMLGPLGPMLEPTGMRVPALEAMPATGFIDPARGRLVASDAEAAASDQRTAAGARTEVKSMRLLGGFVRVEGVSASASATSGTAGTFVEAETATARVYVAGVEVAADDERGLVVAGSHEPFAELLQPVVDLAVDLLDEAGVTLRLDEHRIGDDLAQATALLLELPTPDGQIALSVGYAEAGITPVLPADPLPASSASTGSPGGPASPEATAETVPPQAGTGAPAPPADGDAPDLPDEREPQATADDGLTPPSGDSGPPASAAAAPRLPPLPAAAAEALSGMYVLLLGSGLLGTLLVPGLLRAPGTSGSVARGGVSALHEATRWIRQGDTP